MKWDRNSAEQRMDDLEEICEGFLNLIPANFYLEHEDEYVPEDEGNAESSTRNSKKNSKQSAQSKWDPLAPVTTQMKVVERARENPHNSHAGINKPSNARSKKLESTGAHQDLKAKLHAKIAELKEQRRAAQ